MIAEKIRIVYIFIKAKRMFFIWLLYSHLKFQRKTGMAVKGIDL